MEQNKEDATQAEWSAEFRGKKDRTRARRHFCRFSHGRGLRFSRRRTLRSDPHGPLLRSRFNISYIYIYICVREPKVFVNRYLRFFLILSNFRTDVSKCISLFEFILFYSSLNLNSEEFFIDRFFFFWIDEYKNEIEFRKEFLRLQGAPKECYKNGFVELLYFFGRFYRFSRR